PRPAATAPRPANTGGRPANSPRRPGPAVRREARRCRQLQRQAALLADLLPESVGELLQRAASLPEEEWQAQFTRRYRGQAVVFDADVHLEAGNQFSLDYQVRAGAEQARIDVNDLKLLPLLPRDRPPRLLFGVRLASIAREPPGIWVVRFEPDSGVLLTHHGAVLATCPPPFDDELEELLDRQARWDWGLP